jgi:hypothetical protein
MPQSLAGWALLALLGLSRPDAAGTLSKPDLSGAWTTVDFETATCGHIPPSPLTFSLPPGYVVRNPHHGGEAGCFWGKEQDLDRALESSRQISFENLEHGIFQARLTPNVSYDEVRRKFAGEKELREVLAEAGIGHLQIAHRSFAHHAGMAITGRRGDGFELYLLYLAGVGEDGVLLINYRTATPPTPADSTNWRRFLEEIR